MSLLPARLSPAMRWTALALHVALLALLVIRSGPGSGAIWALPLLAPLPGLWAGRSYTQAWASMLIAFYVAGYLSEAVVDPEAKWPAIGMASLAALEFVALTLAVRFRAREREALARESASQTPASDAASR